jgi:hypothetical protein
LFFFLKAPTRTPKQNYPVLSLKLYTKTLNVFTVISNNDCLQKTKTIQQHISSSSRQDSSSIGSILQGRDEVVCHHCKQKFYISLSFKQCDMIYILLIHLNISLEKK